MKNKIAIKKKIVSMLALSATAITLTSGVAMAGASSWGIWNYGTTKPLNRGTAYSKYIDYEYNYYWAKVKNYKSSCYQITTAESNGPAYASIASKMTKKNTYSCGYSRNYPN